MLHGSRFYVRHTQFYVLLFLTYVSFSFSILPPLGLFAPPGVGSRRGHLCSNHLDQATGEKERERDDVRSHKRGKNRLFFFSARRTFP